MVRRVASKMNPKRGGKRTLSVFDKHQLAIARKTLTMHDAALGVMGGPSKAEAREIIKRLTGKAPKENPKRKRKRNLEVGLPSNQFVNAKVRMKGGKIQVMADESVLGKAGFKAGAGLSGVSISGGAKLNPKRTMKVYELYWSPTGQKIATVEASTSKTAKSKAPKEYRKYRGEIYTKEVGLARNPPPYNRKEKKARSMVQRAYHQRKHFTRLTAKKTKPRMATPADRGPSFPGGMRKARLPNPKHRPLAEYKVIFHGPERNQTHAVYATTAGGASRIAKSDKKHLFDKPKDWKVLSVKRMS
jgi:hypothetical protein